MASSDPWITLGRDHAACLAALNRPGTELFVASDHRDRLGFILIAPYGFAGSPYITSIAVAESARGRGMGSQLLRFAVTVAAPGIMHDLVVSQAQMGPVFLVLSLAWTLLSAAVALVGWRGFAIGLILPQLWIIRGIHGVLSAPIYPTAIRTIAVTTTTRLQARASSLVLASVGIGSAVSPLVLTPITARWGWRAALLFTSVLSAASCFLWWALAPRQLALIATEQSITPEINSDPAPLRSSHSGRR